jgi:hypothetical protein
VSLTLVPTGIPNPASVNETGSTATLSWVLERTNRVINFRAPFEYDSEQPHDSLPVHWPALPVEHHRQPSTPVDRVLQMQFVEPSHQLQVLFGLGAWLVVVGRSTDLQQFALASNARLFVRFDQRSSLGDRPNCLHFFFNQSRSTVNWPIF